jgi:hypothetical protein
MVNLGHQRLLSPLHRFLLGAHLLTKLLPVGRRRRRLDALLAARLV